MVKDALKEIGKRIKAAGLQKLRWYCQMCQKQCRDENGFKNHCSSESHIRQMKLFAEDGQKFVESYSELFEEGYLTTLKQRHGTARVKANTVYQEYISDRHHIHMNATKWLQLTNFVKHLGREGLCVVEDTPKGWYITYIDRDPAKAQAQAEKARNEANDLDASERWQLQMEKQLAYLREHIEIEEHHATELQRAEGDEPLTLSWKGSSAPKFTFDTEDFEEEGEEGDDQPAKKIKSERAMKVEEEQQQAQALAKPKTKINFLKMVESAKDTHRPSSSTSSAEPNAKKQKVEGQSAMDKIMAKHMQQKEARGRKDYWLHEGIVVKVLNKKVGDGKYYKQKAVVKEVVDRYLGVVKMIDIKGMIKVDQEDLETVIPQIGAKVLIVNGAYRGEVATLQSVNQDRFCADVLIAAGTKRGTLVQGLEYEDFSKLHVD
mmetsp:Transcript_20466/g.36579  ORF Transcript_20466/g.36579 Transcript_20466/m.36579 type:complete len:433 (-) Transcript_20466:140-1438(-)